MQNASAPTRNLSEIGHLFLSSVRDRHTNGAPMPRRQPPGTTLAPLHPPAPVKPPQDASVRPLQSSSVGTASPEEPASTPPVTAVLASHLSGMQIERVKRYARHLASTGKRVGLIEIDNDYFRLTRFDPCGDEAAEVTPEGESGPLDARSIADALQEMSWDLDRWLLLLPNPRSLEARVVRGQMKRWVLLSTCDYDGVVAAYRSLKGVGGAKDAQFSLALLDAKDSHEADAVYRKLAGVSQQFLGAPLVFETLVAPAPEAAEYPALCCRGQSKRADGAAGAHWQVLSDFLSGQGPQPDADEIAPAEVQVDCEPPALNSDEAEELEPTEPEVSRVMKQPVEPISSARVAPASIPFPASRPVVEADDFSDVIELPEGEASNLSILTAVLRSESPDLIECPVTPPMCPEAKLAVGRDGRIVLLAAARQGLGELRAIGRAYQWLMENHRLICMAMPQLAISGSDAPCLRLLIDHADVSAEILQPMLQSGTVSVQAYRRLRWGGKTGLLLEAA